MKKIIAKYIPYKENKRKNFTVGEHYEAVCPFCEKTNWAWYSEVIENRLSGNSKCEHFVRHEWNEKNPRFYFQKNIPIRRMPDKTVVIKQVIRQVEIEGNLLPLDSVLEILEDNGEHYFGGDTSKKLDSMGCLSHTTGGHRYTGAKGEALYHDLLEIAKKDA
jgi:hypothetical protein